MPKKPKNKKYSKAVMDLTRFGFGPLLFMSYRPKYYYADGAPKRRKIEGRAIIVCNHVSFYDAFIVNLAWIRRRVHVLTHKNAVDSKKFHGRFLRKSGAIRIDPDLLDVSSFRSVIEYMNEEEVVAIFPEGHISPDGRLKSFQAGIFLTAVKGNAPVIPMYISLPLRLRTTHVYIGKPITPAEAAEEAQKTGEKPAAALSRLVFGVMSGFEREYLEMRGRKKKRRGQNGTDNKKI